MELSRRTIQRMILRKSGDTTVINQGSEGGGGGSQPSVALGPLLTSLNSEAMPTAEGYLHWTGSAWAFDTPTGGDPVDLTPYALKTWVQDNFAYKNDLVNFITKTEADGYYAALNHTHANYLPLSAGANKALTGSLYFSGNSGINWAGGVGMLACMPESGWTGISSSQWGVGALSAQGVIRSNANDILHYRNGTNYKIWDAYNFTPSDYLPLTGGTVESLTVTNGLDADAITVGSIVNSDTLAEYLDQDASDARYLQLTGGTMTGNLVMNGNGIALVPNLNYPNIYYQNGQIIILGPAVHVQSDGQFLFNGAQVATEPWVTAQLGSYLPLTGGTVNGNLNVKGTIQAQDSNGNNKVIIYGTTGNIRAEKVYIGGSTSGYEAATHNWVTSQGYQANVIETVKVAGTALTPTNKAVDIPAATSDGVTFGVVAIGTGFTFDEDRLCVDTSTFATRIWADGRYLPLTGGTVNGNLNVKGTIQAQDSNGNNKVIIYGTSGNIRAEKVYIGGSTSGYEAATHNWVTSQGYQANVIETVKVAGTALTPTNKAVDIPAATSDGSTFGVVAIGTGFSFDEDRLCVAEAPITMGFKRLNKSTSETWDANNMTVNGTQYALLTNYRTTSEWANMPSGMSWGGVLQITAGSGTGYLSGQLAWDSNHNVTTGVTRKLYWRSRNSTGWGTDDWHTIAFEDWVTGQLGSYLPLTGGTLTNSLFITRTDSSVGKVSASNANGAIELLTYSNRGVYDRTADHWLIGTNGTSTFLLDGNVGIGTTTPAAKLDVNGNLHINGTLTGVTNIGGLMIFDQTNAKVTVGKLDVSTLDTTSISIGESGYKITITSDDSGVAFKDSSEGYSFDDFVSIRGEINGVPLNKTSVSYPSDVAGTTVGYRLLGKVTQTATNENNKRTWVTFQIGSKHNGAQIVNIVCGCDQPAATFDLDHAYCEIEQHGTLDNSTNEDVIYAYAKQSGASITWSFFWRNRDTSPAEITLLANGGNRMTIYEENISDYWMTDISSSTYGTLMARGQRRIGITSSYITSNVQGLTSYWAKIWDISLTTQQNIEKTMIFDIEKYDNNTFYGTAMLWLKQNGGNGSSNYNISAKLDMMNGNIPAEDFKLYINNTTGKCELWCNIRAVNKYYNFTVLKRTSGAAANDAGVLGMWYSVNIQQAQTPPSSAYTVVNATYRYGDLHAGNTVVDGQLAVHDSAVVQADVMVGDSLYFGNDYNAPRLYIDNGHLYFNGTLIA